MKIDRSTKAVLILIAVGLWLNAIAPLIHSTPVRASESFSCNGEVKVNAFGATEPSIGGYKVDLKCL